MEKAKKQIAKHLEEANNVLVTVSRDPSVDQLAGAIAMALALTKLNKHAAAVFSGSIPSTIEFLHPEDTIEKTTDSLRDFIISLDKSKADKVRCKVEDEHVKVFITPYRSSINQEDLDFSQGDFNVDVVLALGVKNQEDIDQAITAHGRILHDATVITVDLEEGAQLGSVNWANPRASSLCEMLTQVVDDLQKDTLDTQISNALLTGIVSETERFSNSKTAASTMSISARLLAAGADQQLVAEKLQPQPEPEPEPAPVYDDFTVPDEYNGAFDDIRGRSELPSVDENKGENEDEDEDEEQPFNNGRPAPGVHPDKDGSSALFVDHSEPGPAIDTAAEEYSNERSPEDRVSQIHIDEHGQIAQPDDDGSLARRLQQSNDEDSFLSALAKQSDIPRTDMGPPSLGHKLLSHDNTVNASDITGDAEEDNSADETEKQPDADVQEQQPESDDSVLPAMKADEQSPIQPPYPPAAVGQGPILPPPAPTDQQQDDGSQTLADIEQSVGSIHLRPDPQDADNLSPADMGIHSDDETIVSPTVAAAPPVPPPMPPNMSLPPMPSVHSGPAGPASPQA
ncbi:hypothetical protein CR970_01770 [Candidatus Saccharibacteria bacterium]|nr:MAG: hypothetical protein CR970_01770 [Candidatus Saccharibacteria bacterium]